MDRKTFKKVLIGVLALKGEMRAMGRAAFNNNVMAAPALDPTFYEWMKENPAPWSVEGSVKRNCYAMECWSYGWNQANIEAPILKIDRG